MQQTVASDSEVGESGSGGGARQRRTARLLTARARELTGGAGLSSFTVQELCDEVGVSRRTFFNYFSGKEDAVLGISRGAEDDHVRAFMAARSGDLVADLVELAVEAFAELALTADDLALISEVLRREPTLLATLLRQAQEQQERFVVMVTERENLGTDRLAAEVAVKVIGCLVSLAAEAFLAPANSEPFDRILRRRLAAASALLAPTETRTDRNPPRTDTRTRPKDLVTTP